MAIVVVELVQDVSCIIFRKRNLYYFIGVTLGTVTESPLHAAVEKALDKIYGILLR